MFLIKTQVSDTGPFGLLYWFKYLVHCGFTLDYIFEIIKFFMNLKMYLLTILYLNISIHRLLDHLDNHVHRRCLGRLVGSALFLSVEGWNPQLGQVKDWKIDTCSFPG